MQRSTFTLRTARIALFALGIIAALTLQTHQGPAAAASPNASPHAKTLPKGTVIFRRVVIKDAVSGLDAYTMLAPTDWKAGGQVTWNLDSPSAPMSSVEHAANASNTEGFTELPSLAFIWSPSYQAYSAQMGGKVLGLPIVRPVDGPESAIRDVIVPVDLQSVQNVSVISTEELPKVAAAYAPTYAMPGQPAGVTRAAKARVEYTAAGVEKEAEIVCVFISATGPTGMVWGLDHISIVYAPKGSLDKELPKLDMIALSLQMTPKFDVAVQEASKALVQQTYENMAALMQRVEISQNAAEQISASEQSQWESDNDARFDAIENYDTGAIKGMVNNVDPTDGSIVQVPDDAVGAWSNGSEVIWSSDPNFKPSMYDDSDWKPLQPAKNGGG